MIIKIDNVRGDISDISAKKSLLDGPRWMFTLRNSQISQEQTLREYKNRSFWRRFVMAQVNLPRPDGIGCKKTEIVQEVRYSVVCLSEIHLYKFGEALALAQDCLQLVLGLDFQLFTLNIR